MCTIPPPIVGRSYDVPRWYLTSPEPAQSSSWRMMPENSCGATKRERRCAADEAAAADCARIFLT